MLVTEQPLTLTHPERLLGYTEESKAHFKRSRYTHKYLSIVSLNRELAFTILNNMLCCASQLSCRAVHATENQLLIVDAAPCKAWVKVLSR